MNCLIQKALSTSGFPGVFVQSRFAVSKLGPARWAVIAWVVLAGIFWGNLFRFHPSMIDRSYDDTSEQLVIGRMARTAADGLTSGNADLGSTTFAAKIAHNITKSSEGISKTRS